MEASTGIEPVWTDLQSAASPLRHEASGAGFYCSLGELGKAVCDPNLHFSGAVQDLTDSDPWLQALGLSRVANRKTVSIPDRVEDMLLLDTLQIIGAEP